MKISKFWTRVSIFIGVTMAWVVLDLTFGFKPDLTDSMIVAFFITWCIRQDELDT